MSSRFAESYRISLPTTLRQVLLLFPLMATVAVARVPVARRGVGCAVE